MPEPPPPLSQRHLLQTRDWIVQAATDELEHSGMAVLTNALIAQRAGVSERTVYRHFATRESLLEAVAAEVTSRLATPPVPADPEALRDYPAQLFACFEARPQLTSEALQSDLFAHIRDGVSSQRWLALRRLVQTHWPAVPPARREQATVGMRYLLTATTWSYHRRQLGLDPAATAAAVTYTLGCILDNLGPPTQVRGTGPVLPAP